MRRILMSLAVVMALAVPTVALAATLDTGKFTEYITAGSQCPRGADYHIVNPQSGGVDDSTLDVVFSGSGPQNNVSSYASPGHTTHYLVEGSGTLTFAENDLSGFLVISGVKCK